MYVLGNYTKSVAQSFLEINTLGIAVKRNYPKEWEIRIALKRLNWKTNNVKDAKREKKIKK